MSDPGETCHGEQGSFTIPSEDSFKLPSSASSIGSGSPASIASPIKPVAPARCFRARLKRLGSPILVSSISGVLPGKLQSGTVLNGKQEAPKLPTEVLQRIMDEWQMVQPKANSRLLQLKVCTQRYLLKQMRQRNRLYLHYLTIMALGFICGWILSPDPKIQGTSLLLILSIAVYNVVLSTMTLRSLGDNSDEDRTLFRHEASLGVSQMAECLARMFVDVLAFFALPALFIIPFLGSTGSHVPTNDAYQLFAMLAWAYTSLGYLLMLTAGSKNAAPLVVTVSFLISTLFAGAVGVTINDAIDHPGLNENGYGIFSINPGFWGLFACQLLWLSAEPFAHRRSWLLYELRTFGHLPVGADKVILYETRQVPWLSTASLALALVGTVLRVAALCLFVARNYSSAHRWKLARQAYGSFRKALHRLRTRTDQAEASANRSESSSEDVTSSTHLQKRPSMERLKQFQLKVAKAARPESSTPRPDCLNSLGECSNHDHDHAQDRDAQDLPGESMPSLSTRTQTQTELASNSEALFCQSEARTKARAPAHLLDGMEYTVVNAEPLVLLPQQSVSTEPAASEASPRTSLQSTNTDASSIRASISRQPTSRQRLNWPTTHKSDASGISPQPAQPLNRSRTSGSLSRSSGWSEADGAATDWAVMLANKDAEMAQFKAERDAEIARLKAENAAEVTQLKHEKMAAIELVQEALSWMDGQHSESNGQSEDGDKVDESVDPLTNPDVEGWGEQI